MTYKDEITKAMEFLAQDPKVRFIGYNTRHGNRGGGTLATVPEDQCIETPVAENLMLGMGLGMALAGFKPVVYFERMDFLMNAMDQLVNHVDKFFELSHSRYDPILIIRCVVGNTQSPLLTGLTHTQDHSSALLQMTKMNIVRMRTAKNIVGYYQAATFACFSTVLVEYKDLYSSEE